MVPGALFLLLYCFILFTAYTLRGTIVLLCVLFILCTSFKWTFSFACLISLRVLLYPECFIDLCCYSFSGFCFTSFAYCLFYSSFVIYVLFHFLICSALLYFSWLFLISLVLVFPFRSPELQKSIEELKENSGNLKTR